MVDTIGRAKIIVETVIDKSSLDTSSGKIGSKLKVGATVGVAALGTLAVAGVKAFQAFEEGQASVAKLSNVLGNMGKSGAVEAVDDLASSLQRQTGISDDTIRSGQTLLATFSEVAASAGEVGGVFERATRAAVDMSAAGFGSVESASIQLGKALQDPIKGVTALARSGVTFTDNQKQMIQALVDTGKAGEAQAMILEEVEKQVGGTGEATAIESAKIKDAMGEVEESVGKALAALLGKGKGGSLSAQLYKLSDAISAVADSKDWQKLGDNVEGSFGPASRKLNKYVRQSVRELAALADILNDVQRLLGLGESENDKLLNKDYPGGGGLEDLLNPLGLAGGGRVGSGLRLVGENGPEIVSMGSGGGYVHNNSETRGMLAGASQGGNTFISNFYGPENLAEARRREDWSAKYGTRFGAATNAGAM